ncbi:MAG TPA: hypothetical protein EYO33_23950 [Phycisphaerales bacterium]|nr:hypothetical protein [Phycisphaerales bacterium]|tara:strand:- start:680 stop:1180 length:501 start_codon:yes stop_codon:yes gene_type:complete
MASNIEAGKEALQDINTYVQIGKWSAILGTGYMLHKNRRVGMILLARQGWAVGTAAFRLAIQISAIWYQEVVLPWRMARAAKVKPPPIELVKDTKTGRYTKPGGKPIRGFRPGGGPGMGGAGAFFLFGGLLVNAFVQAGDWLSDNLDGFSLVGDQDSGQSDWDQIR